MFNFFAEQNSRKEDFYYISGKDYNHIKNVLRMKVGNRFLISENGESNLCEIVFMDDNVIKCEIIEENYNDTSLSVNIFLFQGLPKAEKMELIIQKCTELGVSGIYPVEMAHCVVKLDAKKKGAKVSRWQSIAESASKQSKRNSIPKIYDVLSYKQALNIAKNLDLFIVPYENEQGMLATKEALSKIRKGSNIGILIGPEGGFAEDEIAEAGEFGGLSVSLGKRILRTETAAIASVAMCMLYTEMNESE